MSSWLQDEITAQGEATLSCASPSGKIKGQASISVVPGMDPRIEITVDRYLPDGDYSGPMFAFLEGAEPEMTEKGTSYVFGGGVNPSSLLISTPDGQYSGSQIVYYGGDFGKAQEIVRPHLTDLTFRATGTERPAFLVLPLVGFVTRFFPLPELRAHPLAVDPERPSGIRFEVGGRPAYIQPVSVDDENGKRVSAVIVMDAPADMTVTTQSLRQHAIFDVLSPLSFATGSGASIPWVELRDNSGKLVARLHVHSAQSVQSKRHEFLTLFDSGPRSGLGPFLTQYMALADDTRVWLHVAMNLCVLATPGSSTVDDNLAYVFRVLELFIRNHRIGRIDLGSQLSEPVKQGLDIDLTALRERISDIRKKARNDNRGSDDRALERIQSRLANLYTSDSDIGTTLVVLLQRFGFGDVEVLDTRYFPAKCGKTFTRFVSELRQDAVHEGYIEFRRTHDIHEVFQVLRHLHDLVARLIFKECKYEGTYNPGVGRWTESVPIDWVVPSLDPARLGFD